MPNLALADLVLPYVMRGENLGAQHAALALLRVVQFDSASHDFGVVVRGRCQFNGRLSVNPASGGLRVDQVVNEAAPAFDPSRRSPVFDLRETTVDFELFVPRVGSALVAQGVQGVYAVPAFANTRAVLDVWDALPLENAPSDFPASGFVLDLIVNAPTVRPPFLHPARLNGLGLLDSDPAAGEVALTLPRLRFRLSHGNAVGSQLRLELTSAGAVSLEDPADIGVADLITMTPPYAFIGGVSDRFIGIGFRSATLDLSAETTPPAILAKAAVGDDWTGLYLPEVRVFFSPQGARDLAFEAGARELLIDFGENDGFWGDFETALVNQGSGELKLSARFIDARGRHYAPEATGATSATARVPEQTRLVVDVEGGRAPYRRFARVGAGSETESNVWVIDLAV
jgi:large repetitive protein